MHLLMAQTKNGEALEIRYQKDSDKIMFFGQDYVSEWNAGDVGINLIPMKEYFIIQVFCRGLCYMRIHCPPEHYLDTRIFFMMLGFKLPDSPELKEITKRCSS